MEWKRRKHIRYVDGGQRKRKSQREMEGKCYKEMKNGEDLRQIQRETLVKNQAKSKRCLKGV